MAVLLVRQQDPVQAWGAVVPMILPWLITLWGIGVGTLTIRSVVGWVRLHRRVLQRATPLHEFWRQRVETLKQRIGLNRAVRILSSVEVTTPIVMGVVYFLVLTPIGIAVRTVKGNPLVRSNDGSGYWIAKDPDATTKTDMRRQF